MLCKNKFTFDLIAQKGQTSKSLLWEKINPQGKRIEFAEMVLRFPTEHFRQTSIIMQSNKFKSSIAIPDIVLKVLFPKNVLSIQKTLQTLVIEFKIPQETVKHNVQEESRNIHFRFSEGSDEIAYNNFITRYEKKIYCRGFNNENIFYIPLQFMIDKTKHYNLFYQKKTQQIIVVEPYHVTSNYEFSLQNFPVLIPANSR